MVNRLIINDIDVFSNYGVFVVEEGLEELVQYPALKKITTNDWAEENGLEPDLSVPVLSSRSLTINFAILDKSYSTIESFISFLSTSVYNDLYFNDIGYSFKLRLSSESSLSMYDKLGFFSLCFADDFPLMYYSYLAPNGSCESQGVSVSYSYIEDGEKITVKNDFSSYGVMLIDNSFNNLNTVSNIKTRLSRDIKSLSGVIYDSSSKVCFSSRTLSLNCLITSDTNADFWRNYNALLYDLTRADGNIIYYEDKTLSSYYYSSTVTEFIADDKGVWCGFTINLIIYDF